jgi:flagellar motor switch protein FliM
MTTMTNALEIQIEELRAELRNADPAERRQIQTELEQAQVELAAAFAEEDGKIDADPPH